MFCIHCGAANSDSASYCTRCSARVAPKRAAPAGLFRPMPSPLMAAASHVLPAPRIAGLAARLGPRPLFGAASDALPARIVAAWDAQPPMAIAGSGTAGDGAALDRTVTPVAAPRWLPWLAGAVALAVAAAWAASRWLGPAPEPAQGSEEMAATDPLPSNAPPPEAALPDPPPRRGAELADAINAGLRRLGVENVSVHVAADGTTTVNGTAQSAEDRNALLGMIADVDGVTSVRDALQVRPVLAQSAPAAPSPMTPPPVMQAPAVAPPVARAPVAPPPMAQRPLPLPIERPPLVAAVPATPAPAPQVSTLPHPPASPSTDLAALRPPDAAQVTRTVQRALNQLALAGVTAQVDDSLTVTLRGTVNDPAKKSQALAAARAASPQGKVRDLIFVVEE